MFKFKSQQQCSKTDEELHDILYRNICYDYDATNKYVKTMFSPDKSPGKSFFRIQNVTITKETNNVVSLDVDRNRSAEEMHKMRTDAVCESSLTNSVAQVLTSIGLNPTMLADICSDYCPFSGGGDIAMLSFNNSAVIKTPQFEDIEPNSPLADGEVKVSFDMEFKRSTRSNENLLKQLIANMMVVAAMSLEKVCNECIQSEIKNVSTYGLAVDSILPLQLFKLTIDFDQNCVVIINKQNIKLSAVSFLDFDILLTYMIRNCVHTF